MSTITRNPFSKHLVDVTTASGIDAVLSMADLDFEVEKVDLHSNVITDDGVTTVEFTENAGIVAHRGGQLVPYKTVGKNYHVIQYAEAFEPLQYLKDEGFITGFEQAGVVDNGRRGFVLANLDSSTTLTSDPNLRQVMFSTSHDGTAALRVQGWLKRLSCTNQMNSAMFGIGSGRENRIVSIHHTRNASLQLAHLREAVLMAVTSMDVFELELERLANDSVAEFEEARFIRRLMPFKWGIDRQEPSTLTQSDATHQSNVLAKRRKLDALLDASTQAAVKGTKAALLHAAIEYSDYHTGSRAGERILKGTDVPFKQRALQLVRAM